jgi:hypothetical protein
MFFDIDAAVAYINKNGLSQWASLIDSTMISGTTFGTDTYVTGGTYNSATGIATFTNNTGGTFNVGGFYTGSTDVYVTGGTYNAGTGAATFRNNTGGTFTVFGFNTSTGNTSPTIVSYTYNPLNNTFTITDSTGNTFNAIFTTVSGLTVTNGLSATTISATTFYGDGSNLTGLRDVFVTGGTYSNGVILFRNNTGGTFTVTNLFSGSTDVFVTGGTYNAGTGAATFTNNTGGTFNVIGFSSLTSTTIYNGNGSLSSNRTVSMSSNSLTFSSNTVPNTLVLNGGNIGVGVTTNAGSTYRLDVSGATRITNNVPQGTLLELVSNNTYTGFFASNYLVKFNPIVIDNNASNNTAYRFFDFSPTITHNAGITFGKYLNISPTYTTTGSTDINATDIISITPSFTGQRFVGFGGNVRGLYIAPSYSNVALTNFIAIQTVSGNTIFGSSQGNTLIGTATDAGYKLDVMGTTRLSGASNPLAISGLTAANDPNVLTIDNGGIVHTIALSALTGTNRTDVFVTGGTYSNGVILFRNNTGGTFTVTNLFSGTTDVFVTGGTYSNGVILFRNNTGGTFTVTNLFSGTTDVFVTGGTYNAGTGTATFTNNTGGTFNIGGFFTGNTDVFVTGGTYNNGVILFRNNTGGTFTVTNLFSGSTDVFVTGGTYSNGVILFRNNTGGTFTVTNLFSGTTDVFVTGGTYSNGVILFRNNTGGTFTVTNLFSGTTDVFVTGGTYSNGVILFRNNTGGTFTVTNLFSGSTDVFVTGGTYNNVLGTATFTNNTGGTFTVVGFNTSTGNTSPTITSYTYNPLNNTFTITDSTGNTFNAVIRSVSGLTVNGTLLSNVISATTYQNLPLDIFVTGGTYSNGVILFRNNTGGTFTVTNLFSGTTDVFVTGGTYNNGVILFRNNTGGTFTVTNLFSGSTDVFVTGGTYSNGVILFRNNTGGTFTVTNLFSGTTDVFVTGGTYSNTTGTATFRNNTGGTFTVNGFFTGSTDVYVTGGTYNAGTGTATFRNNTGGTFTVVGFNTSTGNTSPTITSYTYNPLNNTFTITDSTGNTFNAQIRVVSGLTVNGTLLSNVISATTYQNLPLDVFVTGGTYSNGVILFRNNTGGTFTVTNLFSGTTDVFVTGGTYSNGVILFRNNTGGTFTVTNLFSGSTDVFVTGGTYNAGTGTATFTNNTGGTFNVGGFASSSGVTLYLGNGTLVSNRTVGLSSFTLNFSSATQANTLVLSGGSVGVGKSNPTEKLDVQGNLRLSGAFMPSNNSGLYGQILTSAGPGAAPFWNSFVDSGYTPTTSGGTNVAGITATTASYQQIGLTIQAWGEVLVKPTSANVFTDFSLTLPVTGGAFAATQDLAGTAHGLNLTLTNAASCRVFAGIQNYNTIFAGIFPDTGTYRLSYHYSYGYNFA